MCAFPSKLRALFLPATGRNSIPNYFSLDRKLRDAAANMPDDTGSSDAMMLGGASGDARSPRGHAAFSMRGTDDRWVVIQLNTFRNWVSEQLRRSNCEIEDLQMDFSDGTKLCKLVEALQGKSVGRFVPRPMNQLQALENCTIALAAITRDNIKLVNIGRCFNF